MFYWGDYLAIGILLFTTGFLTGWVLCSTRDYESIVDEKRQREVSAIKERYEREQERYKKQLKEIRDEKKKK